jgi:hypothetical protein
MSERQGPTTRTNNEGSNQTSEKQIRANRVNAKRSTGPKSVAGKEKSSRNAEKFGIYSWGLRRLRNGIFSENEDVFFEWTDALIQSLDPRDSLEYAQAERVAATYLQAFRLDEYEAASLEAASGQELLHSADSEFTIDDHLRQLRGFCELLKSYGRPEFEGEADFEAYARFLNDFELDGRAIIEGHWDEKTTPSDDKEWALVFDSLLTHVSPDITQLLEKYTRKANVLEEKLLEGRLSACGRVADDVLEVLLKKTSVLRSRNGRELERQIALYRALKTRDVPWQAGKENDDAELS